MPTVFSHPAPFVCLGLACGRLLSARLLLAGIVCSLLPDADALAFRFNIPYASILGHRGLSHSLAFALALGLAAALIAPLLRSGRKTAFVVCAGAALSHILLDAMTDGGLGVAAFWPFSEARYFLPWRPIAVSPLALRHACRAFLYAVHFAFWSDFADLYSLSPEPEPLEPFGSV